MMTPLDKAIVDKYRQDENGCWIWLRARDRHGYGLAKVSRKTKSAHRVSFERANGPIPQGLCVLHRCDNPPCINPEHLFLGTHADNMEDMCAKGRWVSKLSPDGWRALRQEFESGASPTELARRFGVLNTSIHNVAKKRGWQRQPGSAAR